MSLPTLSVAPTVGMEELLADDHVCKAAAICFPDMQRIFMQVQLDITTEANRDTVGPTILALKHIHDALAVFKARGDLLVENDEKIDRRNQQKQEHKL